MKFKIIGDISLKQEKDREKSYNLELSWGFQDLIDTGIILRFCSIHSFGVPNETLVTLVIEIVH